LRGWGGRNRKGRLKKKPPKKNLAAKVRDGNVFGGLKKKPPALEPLGGAGWGERPPGDPPSSGPDPLTGMTVLRGGSFSGATGEDSIFLPRAFLGPGLGARNHSKSVVNIRLNKRCGGGKKRLSDSGVNIGGPAWDGGEGGRTESLVRPGGRGGGGGTEIGLCNGVCRGYSQSICTGWGGGKSNGRPEKKARGVFRRFSSGFGPSTTKGNQNRLVPKPPRGTHAPTSAAARRPPTPPLLRGKPGHRLGPAGQGTFGVFGNPGRAGFKIEARYIEG